MAAGYQNILHQNINQNGKVLANIKNSYRCHLFHHDVAAGYFPDNEHLQKQYQETV